MDSADTFVFIFAIVDGMSLLFLTVYFVSLNVYELRCISLPGTKRERVLAYVGMSVLCDGIFFRINWQF